jgi:anti-anti-sigma factor
VSDQARVEASSHDGFRLVRVSGEIDLSNVRELADAIGAEVPHDVPAVVVDLSGTTYLDSTGIAMIFRLNERLANGRQELRLLVPPGSPIRAVLDLTNVPAAIPVLDEIGRSGAG